MSIQALIWDLEGVLLISDEKNIEATFAKHLGISAEAIGDLFHSELNDRGDLGEFSQEEFWLHLLDVVGLPRERLAEVRDFYASEFYIDQDLLEKVRAYRKRFKTAMLSNNSDSLRPLLESRWRVDGAFDEVIISCEEKLLKPDPRIFDLTLNRLGASKEEAVLIDDRAVNISGAKNYGLHTVHFRSKAQALDDLEKILASNS